MLIQKVLSSTEICNPLSLLVLEPNVKDETFPKAHKIWKNLPHSLDFY